MKPIFSASRPRRARLASCVGAVLAATAVIAAVGGASATAAQPEGEFRLAAEDGAVGEYVVSLRDNVKGAALRKVSGELSRANGGQRRHVFAAGGGEFSVTMSEKDARRLARDRRVKAVVQDTMVYADDIQYNAPPHLDRIDERAKPLDGKYNVSYSNRTKPGYGKTIYVIDTGVNIAHAEFGGRAFAGPDFANDLSSEWYGSHRDCHNHGTGVASMAAGNTVGVARGAKIVSLKVFRNCDAGATQGDIRAAVEWVTTNATPKSVVNMSLGGDRSFTSHKTEEAIRTSIAAGHSYVLSSGNKNMDACDQTPGRVKEAITVGSTNSNDQRSSFSNYGSCVDLYAVGQDISMASAQGPDMKIASGTSFAAPQVAGATAELIKRHPASTGVPRVKFEATPNAVTGEPVASSNYLLHFGGFYINGKDVVLPDVGGAGSVLDISGQADPGSAMGTHLRVSATVLHPKRGQLNIDLFAPDGRKWRLHSPSSDTGDDVRIIDFPIWAANVAPNGRWTLRVDDKVSGGAGRIASWHLQF